ncbi:MAG TPA: efflux RND transporter permease subunit [Polyangiales bacterium]|nr:efflux RND transporter permease subunit [Polyangiales bacterium]
MKLSDTSIKRPIFTAMIMTAIVLFGAVMYKRLSVDLFPKVDFPIVTVTVVYPGADPETMETKVADPIEEAVNSLSGIDQLRSTSLEGVAQVFVQFDLDVDLDVAAQDVRDRIAGVQRDLPQGAEPPVVEKLDIGASPVLQLAVSGTADAITLAAYAEDVLKPGLERIDGVGKLELVGSREREAHVWIDPDRLRTYGLTVVDVVNALSSQSVDLPGGRVTRGSEELVVRTNAQAATPDELANVVISSNAGAIIRVRDVAEVEDGLEEQRSVAEVDGKSAIAVVLRKQSDANTVKVADVVKKALPALQKLAPPGTRVEVLVDNSTNIKSSVETVQLDLMLGAVLAVVIIFVFLRDWRATFISALALPTSVIGTFAFVKVMGFTLNMMTTLALSLSIGILIDDAIVVIENIVRHRAELNEGPREAASKGTAEIGLAVLATTMSIVAVFVPVAFMEGMVGQFFYEFGLTVAFAVLLSLFVSFTLTPMLSARMLTGHHASPTGISGVIERILTGLDDGYRAIIRWALRWRFVTVLIAVGALAASFVAAGTLGFEFLPPEDRGQFMVNVELPTGSSLAQSAEVTFDLARRAREAPGVLSTFSTVGGGVQEKVNSASIIVTMQHRSKRAFKQEDMMAYLRRQLAGKPGVLLSIEQLAAVSGGGLRNTPVQFNLRGDNLAELETAARKITDGMKQGKGFADIDISYRSGKPQLDVQVDRTRAADLGVMAMQVASTVRTLVAGAVATEFEAHGDRYDVRVQLPDALRTSTDVITRAQVRTGAGELIDVGTLGEVRETTGPSQIDRQSRQRQVTVYASLEGGKALGDALAEVRAIAAKVVPPGVETAVAGMGENLEESNQSMGVSMLLAIACIYMILASQFESLIHPLTIMVSLPFALIGAFGGLLIAHMHMSIFAMIGLIMLMGLVTKNAILLVDFAVHLRAQGQGVKEALENAGATRLRPILMTTAAMVFGMVPVAIGHGDGGEVRAPMGIAIIGGLITSTVLTLVVVPVIYTFMDAIAGLGARLANYVSKTDTRADEHWDQDAHARPTRTSVHPAGE